MSQQENYRKLASKYRNSENKFQTQRKLGPVVNRDEVDGFDQDEHMSGIELTQFLALETVRKKELEKVKRQEEEEKRAAIKQQLEDLKQK